MKLQTRDFPVGHEAQVVQFIPPAQSKRETTDRMGNRTKQLQTLEQNGEASASTKVIRFIPPAQFKREATDMMANMTNQLQTLEQNGQDPALTNSISRSMGAFYQMAAGRGLKDVADLALHVAQALEHSPSRQNETAKRVVALSLVAVSQIQCLLNPSIEGAGQNARLIVGGLLTKW